METHHLYLWILWVQWLVGSLWSFDSVVHVWEGRGSGFRFTTDRHEQLAPENCGGSTGGLGLLDMQAITNCLVDDD